MKRITNTRARYRLGRAIAILGFAAAMIPTVTVRAQPSAYKYDLRLEGGGWVPTGALSGDLKASGIVGVSAGWNYAHDWTAVVAAYWSPSEDKAVSGGMQVNIYQYDVGLEWSTRMNSIAQWDVSPFLGAGVGNRSYSPKRATEPEQESIDGYVTAGLAFNAEQATWRFGVRDYVSGWKGIMKTQSGTGNDLVILAGIGFRF